MLLAVIRVPRLGATVRQPLLASLRAGLGFVRARPLIAALISVEMISVIFIGHTFNSFLVLFAYDVLHVDALGYSFLLVGSGIGAVAAPILVSIAGARYGLIYAGGAAVAAVALLGFRGVPGRLRGASSSGTAPSSRRTARLVVIFATAFGLYVGVEIGVAGWMPTHLHSAGFGLAAAATLTSGFWLALAAGRFLVAPLTLRVSDSAIVLGGTAVAVLCLAGALIAPFAPVAYIATGLAIAPVFPTGVAWLATLNPANPGATSWLFPASMVGGALIPSAIGLVIARVGAGWVPTILAAVAIGTLAAFAAAARSSTRLN